MALVVLGFYVTVAVQQRDPINNFCRRWGHQTAVVDDKLYIDGGLLTYNPAPRTPENFSNPYLIYHDLSETSQSGMPPPYANLSKNSSIPNVHGGILWPDDVNKRLYLFGGEFYQETPWSFSLYAYDIINDHWDNYGSPRSSDVVGVSYGAGVAISNRGEGYYYGGWINDATDADWNDTGMLTSYMIRYDMDANSWANMTGPDDVGRAEGVMVHLPVGDGGMLIYFGGIRSTVDGSWEAQPMNEIILYDVLSGKSYFQNATGDIPELRRRFCAGATWVDDQSSYNIYLYGGLGEAEGSLGYDDIYVLSLPSFTWIRIYPADSNSTGDFPHHSFSCNVINEAQMIIHGGFFPATNDCDASDQWGLHNLDMGKQNNDSSPWALWDPDKTEYVVPTDILSVIGGSSDGGATKTAPDGGFMHQDLRALMTRKASVASRSPTREILGATGTDGPSAGSGLSKSAIIGIGVGGGVVLIAVLVGCFCLVRRYRRNRVRQGSQQPMAQPYDYHHPSLPTSSLSPGPWSPHSSSFNPSSPPPFISRPQTVQSPQGPPVELPSGSMDDVPHVSPYSEPFVPGEPKYDAQGNVWTPQVSMMQVPEQAPSPGTPYHEACEMIPNGVNQNQGQNPGYFPPRTPQELASQTDRLRSRNSQVPVHQTYYHP